MISYKLKRVKEVDNMMRALSDHQIQIVIKNLKKEGEIFSVDIEQQGKFVTDIRVSEYDLIRYVLFVVQCCIVHACIP